MNKKKLLICVAFTGMLLVIAVAILLNSRENTPQPAPGTSSPYGETKVDTYTLDTLSTDPTWEGTVPTISVITGVEDRENLEDQDDNGNTSQGTTQSGNSTPAQGNSSSSQGNNTKPDNSGNSSSGNSGNTSSGNSGSSSDNESTSDWYLSWEEFLALSGPEQDAYFDRFDSIQDYKEWLNAAKQEYEDGRNTVIATGPITLPQE